MKSYDLGVKSYVQKHVDFDRFRETVLTPGLYWLLANQAPPRLILNTFAENAG